MYCSTCGAGVSTNMKRPLKVCIMAMLASPSTSFVRSISPLFTSRYQHPHVTTPRHFVKDRRILGLMPFLPGVWNTRSRRPLVSRASERNGSSGAKDEAMAAIEAAESALDRESTVDAAGGVGGEDVQATVAAARAAARAAMDSLRTGGDGGFEYDGETSQEAFASRQAVISPARAAVEAALAAVAGEETTSPTSSSTEAREAIGIVQAALSRRDSAAEDLGTTVPSDESAGRDGPGHVGGVDTGNMEVAITPGKVGERQTGGEIRDEEPTKEPDSALRTRNNPAGSHVPLAHLLWRQVAGPGDTVLDCTAGNGHDSLELAQIVALKDGVGKLYCIDIQETALEATRTRLESELGDMAVKRTSFTRGNFREMPAGLESMSVQLIVYNLGWLPGGDKSITTELVDTIKSIEGAQGIVKSGGLISVMCYRGHEEGAVETKALLEYALGLTHYHWRVFVHERVNRPGSPVLLTLYRL